MKRSRKRLAAVALSAVMLTTAAAPGRFVLAGEQTQENQEPQTYAGELLSWLTMLLPELEEWNASLERLSEQDGQFSEEERKQFVRDSFGSLFSGTKAFLEGVDETGAKKFLALVKEILLQNLKSLTGNDGEGGEEIFHKIAEYDTDELAKTLLSGRTVLMENGEWDRIWGELDEVWQNYLTEITGRSTEELAALYELELNNSILTDYLKVLINLLKQYLGEETAVMPVVPKKERPSRTIWDATEAFSSAYPEQMNLSLAAYPDLIKGIAYVINCEKGVSTIVPGYYDEIAVPFYYSDHFFDLPSNVYNPHLAVISTLLATSSASSRAIGTAAEREKGGEEDRFRYASRNTQELFSYLGFTDITVNEDFLHMPQSDTIGLCMAKKTVGDTTIIALTTRSLDYEAEWYSDLTLGLEGDHEGFVEAAAKAHDMLTDYLMMCEPHGKVKLWLAGYSRGAAVTNLLGGMLNETDELQSFGITKEDIYDICVASVKGTDLTRKTAEGRDISGEAYNNIKNIVCDTDLVASLSPDIGNGGWNFDRYGEDIVIAMGKTKDTAEYENFLSLLKASASQGKLINPYTELFSDPEEWDSYRLLSYEEQTLAYDTSVLTRILSEAVKKKPELMSEGMGLTLSLMTEGVLDRENGFHPEKLTKAQITALSSLLPKVVEALGKESVINSLVKGAGFKSVENSRETVAGLLDRLEKVIVVGVSRSQFGRWYGASLGILLGQLFTMSGSHIHSLIEEMLQAGSEAVLEPAEQGKDFLAGEIEDIKILVGAAKAMVEGQEPDLTGFSPAENLSRFLNLKKEEMALFDTLGEAYARAVIEKETSNTALNELISTDSGKGLILLGLRLLTASIRYPEAFSYQGLSSVDVLASIIGVGNVTLGHYNTNYIMLLRGMDSWYETDLDAYYDTSIITTFELMGYRTVTLPDPENNTITVTQVKREEGTNSRVENGVVLSVSKAGVTDRKDPGVFVRSTEKGLLLFLPLDGAYEIEVKAEREETFDMIVCEHSVVGSNAIDTGLRVIDGAEHSNLSHRDISLQAGEAVIMTAESLLLSDLNRARYGTEEEAAFFQIPTDKDEVEDTCAFYPLVKVEKGIEQNGKETEAQTETEPAKEEKVRTETEKKNSVPVVLAGLAVLAVAAGGFFFKRKKRSN